jgi:hypothetical protein
MTTKSSQRAIVEEFVPFRALFLGQLNMSVNGHSDAQAFTRSILPEVAKHDLPLLSIIANGNFDLNLCLSAAEAMERGGDNPFRDWIYNEAATRYRFYAACLGDRASAWKIAAQTLFFLEEGTGVDDELTLAAGAIGWIMFAAGRLPNDIVAMGGQAELWSNVSAVGNRLARRLYRRIVSRMRSQKRHGAHAASEGESNTLVQEETVGTKGDESRLVVLTEVGGIPSTGLEEINRQFAEIIRHPLPTVATPDLKNVRKDLLSEFPYAEEAIRAFLEGLSSRATVWFPPTILVGPPGIGKTEFARSLLEKLGVRWTLLSCGGVADSMFGGLSRKWHSGGASLPASLMLRRLTASPGIILDEIDKTADGRKNGNMLDVLLGMLEPSSARIWWDPYLETRVNLSRVIWLATANALEPLPAPLKDRCRIMRFPEPGPGHLAALANRLFSELVGKDPFQQPIQPDELDALARHWSGGSLRLLKRMVQEVLNHRRRDATLH